MSALKLLVLLSGDLVGSVTRTESSAKTEFQYDPDYLTGGATVPLSTRLPLARTRFGERAIKPYLEGLVPEDPQVRRRWADRWGTGQTDAISLLAAMGWDCPGAVQFTEPDRLAEMRERAHERIPCSEAEIGGRLRALHSEPSSWELPDGHWSLAGQQSKFAIIRADEQWFEAKGAAATTHIVKPGIGRLHHQALVEHATMRAASMVGVKTAGSQYREFGGEPAAVVERFDRVAAGPTVLRLHQEDLCQAAGRLPEDKYEVPHGPSLKDMMRVVANTSDDPARDARRLFDFLAINYVAGAPDGHSKNISLLLLPGRVEIAPLYDLASAFSFQYRKGLRDVALSIGGGRKIGEVMPRHWVEAGKTLGLSDEYVFNRVRQLASEFPDAFASVLDDISSDASDEIKRNTMTRLSRSNADLSAQMRKALSSDDRPKNTRGAPRTDRPLKTSRGTTTPASNGG
ncbi:type II toxin-antitoxin system HipA family toxin [Nakamurella lactea]|uniref:type II toxin-antitoxin system HipA family toxin n=1 Tax=Nakamurella lactea TaxID=459515 RepID=UPI00042090B3|nr:type II toxin-antitoxin system HipA family toxin [Nakamurella lactea]